MTQLFCPSIKENNKQKIYCYINNFKQVVIAKINGLKNRHCERVIFPSEKFLFMADQDCELEILQQTSQGIIRHTFSCSQLNVIES